MVTVCLVGPGPHAVSPLRVMLDLLEEVRRSEDGHASRLGLWSRVDYVYDYDVCSIIIMSMTMTALKFILHSDVSHFDPC